MEIVQCDRCKAVISRRDVGAVVSRRDIGKSFYRDLESMADRYAGRVIKYDVCKPCLSEVTSWIQAMINGELGSGEDATPVRESNEEHIILNGPLTVGQRVKIVDPHSTCFGDYGQVVGSTPTGYWVLVDSLSNPIVFNAQQVVFVNEDVDYDPDGDW